LGLTETFSFISLKVDLKLFLGLTVIFGASAGESFKEGTTT
jgi:hypothetical protein